MLQWAPLRWIALPLLGGVEGVKRTLARRYPNEILYVDAPDETVMKIFEKGGSQQWKKRGGGQVCLVSHTDADSDNCARLVQRMEDYYSERAGGDLGAINASTGGGDVEICRQRDDGVFIDLNSSAAPGSRRRQRVQSGSPGSSLLSADNLHPNDKGYDFWGRHIANAIINEWTADGAEEPENGHHQHQNKATSLY